MTNNSINQTEKERLSNKLNTMLKAPNTNIDAPVTKFKDPNPPTANIPTKSVSGLPFEVGLIDSNPSIPTDAIEIDPTKAKANIGKVTQKKPEIKSSSSSSFINDEDSSWSPNGFNPSLI